MALTYEFDSDLAKIAQRLVVEVRDKHYFDLKQHEVTFSVAIVLNLNEDGAKKDEPPMMDGEYHELFRVKPVDLISRSDDRADGQILICGHYFTDELPDDDREGLIDGAMAYFGVQLNTDKTVKVDSAGRPKLEILDPDWKLQGFASVAARRGEHYSAVREARKFQEKYGAVVLKQEDPALFAGA